MVNTFRVSQTGFYADTIEAACNGEHPFTERIFQVDSGAFSASEPASIGGTVYVATSGGKFTVKTGVKPAETRYKWASTVLYESTNSGMIVTYWNNNDGSIKTEMQGSYRGYSKVYDGASLVARVKLSSELSAYPNKYTTAATLTIEQDHTLIGPQCKIPSLSIAGGTDRTSPGLEIESPTSQCSISQILLTRDTDAIADLLDHTNSPFEAGVAPLVAVTITDGPSASSDWPGNGTHELYVGDGTNPNVTAYPYWELRPSSTGGSVLLTAKFLDTPGVLKFSLHDRTDAMMFLGSSTYAAGVLDGQGSFSIDMDDVSGTGTTGSATLFYG